MGNESPSASLVARPGFRDQGITERGVVAIEDGLEKRAIGLALVAAAPLGQALPAFCQCGRALSRPYEAVEDQALDPLGAGLREGGRAQCAARLAEDDGRCAPAFRHDQRPHRIEIDHSVGDVGVAARARRAAVAIVVHRPDIETQFREVIHDGIVVMAGDVQVVARERGKRGAMDQEQHAAVVTFEALPEDEEPGFAFRRPVFVADDPVHFTV